VGAGNPAFVRGAESMELKFDYDYRALILTLLNRARKLGAALSVLMLDVTASAQSVMPADSAGTSPQSAAPTASAGTSQSMSPTSSASTTTVAKPKTTAGSAPASATASVQTAVSEAEVDSLLSQAETEAASVNIGPSLNLYGYADFIVNHRISASEAEELVFGKSPIFSVGNLNLYGAADLTKGWRSLFEIRFMYLPNGSLQSKSAIRNSTVTTECHATR
jgi:hypothetical protein